MFVLNLFLKKTNKKLWQNCHALPGEYLHIHERYLDGCNKALVINQSNQTLEKKQVINLMVSLTNLPDNAKLESARPLVIKATISQGGNPRSTDESIMKAAGDRKAIV
jgi:hypothetical protein